jgi:hypothetical protein
MCRDDRGPAVRDDGLVNFDLQLDAYVTVLRVWFASW